MKNMMLVGLAALGLLAMGIAPTQAASFQPVQYHDGCGWRCQEQRRERQREERYRLEHRRHGQPRHDRYSPHYSHRY